MSGAAHSKHSPTWLALGVALAAGLRAPEAGADPYRLRADVYAFATAPAPAGLVVLSGQAKPAGWADAEALVWMGSGPDSGEHPGDVLVANVRLREPHGWGELRLGRMLITAGAIRPLQLDGASLVGRVPHGPTLNVFGGVPVEPGFAARPFDWVVGQRLSQRIGEIGALGVSYLQRRAEGRIAFEELGLDAALSPLRRLDVAADMAVDLLHTSVSSARASIALRLGPARFEVFGLRRSPAYLLPATSLFAALGNVPSDQAGASLSLRAAPRLDVWTSASFDSIAGDLGGRQSLHTVLRLDDRGDGALGFEMRRQWAPGAGWTGGRGMLKLPILPWLRASAELELAFPDHPEGRGDVWPWGLVSLTCSPGALPWLDVAAAAEAGASASKEAFLSALMRVSATWEKR
jgi:hypothetical protein